MDDQIIIDLADIRDCGSFHKKIKELLGLPDYYGANLDALHDVLTEKRICLKITNVKKASDDMKECLPKIIRVLTDSACENPVFDFEILSGPDYIEEDLLDTSVFD